LHSLMVGGSRGAFPFCRRSRDAFPEGRRPGGTTINLYCLRQGGITLEPLRPIGNTPELLRPEVPPLSFKLFYYFLRHGKTVLGTGEAAGPHLFPVGLQRFHYFLVEVHIPLYKLG